jgi:murein DD-endopeptidase MepM/ murein hydrolase activator NlpD
LKALIFLLLVSVKFALAQELPRNLTHPIDYSKLSSAFGVRVHPVTGGKKLHGGVDFAAPKGTFVRALTSGTVINRSRNPFYGNFVTIHHGDSWATLYAHLDKTSVEVGENVLPGEIIGSVGMTGRATAPHLHFELRYDGKVVNPHEYLEFLFIRATG